MSSSFKPTKGRGTTTRESSLTPNCEPLCSNAWTKGAATKDTVGTPAFSSSAMSWASHDAQLPQSAVLPITPAHSLAICFSSSLIQDLPASPVELPAEGLFLKLGT